MGLIRNKDAGAYTFSKNKFCEKCFNSGLIRVPLEEYQKVYDEEYDRLDAVGSLSCEQCHDAALRRCQYDTFYCPLCEKGEAYKGQYPIYDMGK